MLPISPPSRPDIIFALYAFILIIFPAYAQEASPQQIVLPALRLQAQSAPNPSATPKPQKKKGLAPLRNEEAPEGSRVTITYNAPVNDYSAYRRGDRFVVVIPRADAPRVRSGLRGRGFDSVQVEKRGDDTVISFRIQPGVKARVDQQYNKLEVIFSPSGQPTPNAASNPRLAASASPLAAASKAPQASQTPGVPPQTLLANHNSTLDNTNQPINGKASRDSSVALAASGNQTGATPATSDSSLTPSTEGSAAPVQLPADRVATTQPTPVVSPTSASTSLRMTVMRYWLPLLIAALLLTSAYAVIAARRKAERSSRIAVATARVTGEVEAETIAPRDESVEEMTSADEEAEPVQRIEKGIETEIAVESTPKVTQQDVTGDVLLPEAPAFNMQSETSALISAGAAPVEQREDHESRALRPTEADDKRPEHEATEQAAQSNRTETVAGAAKRAVVIEEPFTADVASPRIPSTILRYLGSDDAYERAAAVLDLAELGSDDAFRMIGAAFDDPEQLVRESAARSLFNVSDDRAASFKRIMRESSPERRRRIGAAIDSSGMAGEAISDLASESGERAYDALLVLSLMAKAGEVQSLIETIEEHSATEVRLAIVKLLALSGQPEILSTFRYLATRDSLPVAVRSSIMEAIFQLNNQRPLASSATHQ